MSGRARILSTCHCGLSRAHGGPGPRGWARTCRRTSVPRRSHRCGAWVWADGYSFLRFYRKYQNSGQTCLTCSHAISPCGCDSTGRTRMLASTTGARCKAPNCYRVTGLIHAKDHLSRKTHTDTCTNTLYTIIGRNPGPPKDKGSEILSPLWLSGAYYKTPPPYT